MQAMLEHVRTSETFGLPVDVFAYTWKHTCILKLQLMWEFAQEIAGLPGCTLCIACIAAQLSPVTHEGLMQLTMFNMTDRGVL